MESLDRAIQLAARRPYRFIGGKGRNCGVFTWRDRQGRRRARARLEICLACGGRIEEPLVRLGSLRCLDCREANSRLDEALVRRWRPRGARLDL